MSVAKGDRGSTIPLFIFFVFLGLSVIAVVASATSLYIERKRLFTLADGAALAASESFSLAQLSRTAERIDIHLGSTQVQQAAREYLSQAASELTQPRILAAASPDGQSARVTIAAEWAPPLLSELIPWRLTLNVTASARTVFRH